MVISSSVPYDSQSTSADATSPTDSVLLPLTVLNEYISDDDMMKLLAASSATDCISPVVVNFFSSPYAVPTALVAYART